ncbi:hypothetical protein SUGI_0545440 [Cryptomeria japonica]|nr:hypothetical protein SUGI_0545440 [Cryptomeria japonica]
MGARRRGRMGERQQGNLPDNSGKAGEFSGDTLNGEEEGVWREKLLEVVNKEARIPLVKVESSTGRTEGRRGDGEGRREGGGGER